jgi:rod shape-determining protein MreD
MLLDQLHLHGYINPYIYPLFILLLPFKTPRWLELTLGFAIGISMDLFNYSYGMHAAASVLLAFFRPAAITLFSTTNTVNNLPFPSLSYLGFKFFVSYAALCILVHHAALFAIQFINSLSLTDALTRILLSSAVSLILVLLSEYLFMSTKDK